MARTVTEWVGKTDDSAPSKSCKLRILARQDRRCALTGVEFKPGDHIQFDHKTPLWLGGENRERNLQAVLGEPHKGKTKAEAKVRAKVNGAAAKHMGITTRKQKIPGRGFPAPDKPERITKQSLPPRQLFGLWPAGRSTGEGT